MALCGGERSHLYAHAGVDNWLRAEARKDRMVGSISDGAYVAARAGLFDRVPSTIHWKCLSAYRELYPTLDIRSSIFEVSERRFSCAGGTASLVLMLHFVSRTLDDHIAGRIADNYFHDVIRGDDQVQQMASAFRFAARNSQLSKALHLMEANLEEPLSIGEIADEVHQSHRQLDRLFRKYLNASPAEHYRDLRLHRASGLLKQSGLSITEIAQSCGFHSASHLSKFFVRKFNITPGQHRRSG